MSEREVVNCEVCRSFSHSTKEHKKIARVERLCCQKELPDLLHSFARDVLCEPRADSILCRDIEAFLERRSKGETKGVKKRG